MRLEVLVKADLPYKKYKPDLSLQFMKCCLMCTMWTIPEHKRAVQKAHCVNKIPRVLALQKSLAHTNIFVERSTINKTWNKNVVRGWKHPCTFKVCERARGRSTSTLRNVLWTDESWVVWKEHKTLCVDVKWHGTPSSEPHPNWSLHQMQVNRGWLVQPSQPNPEE